MPRTDLRYAVIIPARFKSSRFPGKPLVEIAGKSMIQRVWERCVSAVDAGYVYIATDDDRIAGHCAEFTPNIIMTSEECLTGTDRVAEAARQLELDFVINVQGDEPLLDPTDIQRVLEAYTQNEGCIINAMCPILDEQEFVSLTVPKVVATPDGNLLYMSRAPIPGNKNNVFRLGWKQVCIYAFPCKAIQKFASCSEKTPLEQEEDIEILRFLEMGYQVKMIGLAKGPVAVDTPEDRIKVEKIIDARPD